LQFADDSLPFCVEANSSDFVTGSVLLQQSPEDNKWHPVLFYSKLLNNVEWNYEIHDKEMLAIIRALEEWHHFSEGLQHKFEIWTDHKNLEYFSINFISKLPESHGYDAIMVVVNLTSKCGHFIPTHTTATALGSVPLYLQHVWKLHRLPLSVLSDCGPQFVSQFMRKLYRLLSIKVAASTAYHPQTNGQTEHVNQELEQYLHIFVNERQDNWDKWLQTSDCLTACNSTCRS